MKKEDINLNSKVVLGRLFIVLSLCLMLTSLIYPSTGRHLEAGVYSMITLLTSLLVVMGMVMEFEGHEHSTKLIALIAMLGTISAISRVPFVGLPGVQPCTFFTICTGIVFGPVAGFMVGAISAVVSNLFLGEGPWTIFQMLAWGMVGLVSGMLRIRLPIKRHTLLLLATYGFVWGFVYGWIMNIWHWVTFIYPLNWQTFLATQMTSVMFDAMHATGNLIFILLLAPTTLSMLDRYKKRFEVVVEVEDKKDELSEGMIGERVNV